MSHNFEKSISFVQKVSNCLVSAVGQYKNPYGPPGVSRVPEGQIWSGIKLVRSHKVS